MKYMQRTSEVDRTWGEHEWSTQVKWRNIQRWWVGCTTGMHANGVCCQVNVAKNSVTCVSKSYRTNQLTKLITSLAARFVHVPSTSPGRLTYLNCTFHPPRSTSPYVLPTWLIRSSISLVVPFTSLVSTSSRSLPVIPTCRSGLGPDNHFNMF